MRDCNPSQYKMEPNTGLTKDEQGTPVDPTKFRSVVDVLIYLIHTRPNISYTVGSHFMGRPTVRPQQEVKRILR